MPARRKTQNANGRPVWADVSLSALAHNLHAIRDFVNPKSENRSTPRKVLCIVKGNGYGHGGPQVAKVLERFGANKFAKPAYANPFLLLPVSGPAKKRNFSPTKFRPPSFAANNWSHSIPRHRARKSPNVPQAST